MAANDPEPKVPVSDTGNGLVIGGWLLLIGTITLNVAIPPHVRVTNMIAILSAIGFVVSVPMIIVGHVMRRRDFETLDKDTVEAEYAYDERENREREQFVRDHGRGAA